MGADPRFFGARSDRDCGRLSFMAGWTFMLRWPLMMSFVVLGLLLVKGLFPDKTVLAQAATLIGLCAAILQRIFLPFMPEWQQFLFMVGAGTFGSLGATYPQPPTERGVLEHFYRTTKPFGLWGPLRRAVPKEEAAAMSREHKFDLISLPFALFWQLSMLMLPMLLIIRQLRSAAVAGAVLTVSLAGLYFFWYRHLPK